MQADAEQRSSLLRNLQLLSASTDPEFDELVELAANICGKPLGAMTLLDVDTQLMKARVGFKGSRTMPVRESICQYTVRGEGLMMVEDVGIDPRFQNATLQDDLGIRFYAGVPLHSQSGCAVGALRVMDVEPATLDTAQRRALEILGHQVSAHIQMRERANALAAMAMERDRQQRMFNTILNHVPVGIYLKDRDGRIRFYNQALADRFRIDRDAWMGKTSHDLWDSAIAEQIMSEDKAVLNAGLVKESFVTVPDAHGDSSFWKSYKVPCENVDGEPVLACCSIDLTEQIRRESELQKTRDELQLANDKLHSLSLTDALTGLWNRRAFDGSLETAVIASQRNKQPMALMLIDADHFKSINDRYGHPYGDTVLRNIATVLNRTTRAEEIVCRFGGEEFAVLLPGHDEQGAAVLAQRVLESMKLFPWEHDPVTVSIGLAMCCHSCSSDELLDHADDALYQAKSGGRNRAVVYQPRK